MLNMINNFANDESGAVTVDWVVLTAALVGLGLAVMGVVSTGVGEVAGGIEDSLSQDHVGNSLTQFNTGIQGSSATTVTAVTTGG